MISPNQVAKDPLAVLERAERDVVRMQGRIGGDCLRIDSAALSDISRVADGMCHAAKAFGWRDLSACAAQLCCMVQVAPDSVAPIILQTQLGRMLVQMDRHIVERRRLLAPAAVRAAE